MLIDSHCHIPSKKYNIPPKQVVKEAVENGVTKLISIGTSLEESREAINTAKEFDNVYPSCAIYPHGDVELDLDTLEIGLKKLLKEKPVAIGECGIDLPVRSGGRTLRGQIELFEMQANLATKEKLPLLVHNRNGDKFVLEVLTKYKNKGLKGVIHCFDSDWDLAKKVLDLGFGISFSGLITYENKSELIEVVKKVPLKRFLVETDAPFLAPGKRKGEINYPKYVKIICEKVAQVKEKPFELIAHNSYTNTCRLFEI